MVIVPFVLHIVFTLCAANEKDIHYQKDTSNSDISPDITRALIGRVQILEAKEKATRVWD